MAGGKVAPCHHSRSVAAIVCALLNVRARAGFDCIGEHPGRIHEVVLASCLTSSIRFSSSDIATAHCYWTMMIGKKELGSVGPCWKVLAKGGRGPSLPYRGERAPLWILLHRGQ